MSPRSFPTSPGATGEQRKFVNPTPGFVGANIFGADGKPTATYVEPGGEIWLTPEEERMTAEAPTLAENNPFVRRWEEPVEWDADGVPIRSVAREGTLVLSEDPPRPVASSRFIPGRAEPVAEGEPEPELEPERAAEAPPEQETITGAPPQRAQPPVEGQPSPDEVVGTPEAIAANDKALAEREGTAEQRTVPVDDEEPLPVG